MADLCSSEGEIRLDDVIERYQIETVGSYPTLGFWLIHGCSGLLSHEGENGKAKTLEHWMFEIGRDYRSVRRYLKSLEQEEMNYRGFSGDRSDAALAKSRAAVKLKLHLERRRLGETTFLMGP